MVVDFKEQSLEFLKKIFFDMLTNIPYFISLIKVRCKKKKKSCAPLYQSQHMICSLRAHMFRLFSADVRLRARWELVKEDRRSYGGGLVASKASLQEDMHFPSTQPTP